MDLSLNTKDIEPFKRVLVKPYSYGEQYKDVATRKYTKRPRKDHVSLDLNSRDVPGAAPKIHKSDKVSIPFNKLINC